MDRWKSRGGKSQRRERERRKKMQVREKVRKSRFTVFFQWFVAPEGRKVGLLKRRVRSQLDKWEMNNCTPLWREAHLEVKALKAPHGRSTFGSWDVAKARRCGAKHVSKSKCTKHTILGPLLEVEMSKKWTPLWREAHVQVKMLKACKNTKGSDHFWTLRCARRCGAQHISKSLQVKVVKTWGFEPCLNVQKWKKCTLTNLTNLTSLTSLSHLTNLTNFTNLTSLPNLTHLTNLTPSTN